MGLFAVSLRRRIGFEWSVGCSRGCYTGWSLGTGTEVANEVVDLSPYLCVGLIGKDCREERPDAIKVECIFGICQGVKKIRATIVGLKTRTECGEKLVREAAEFCITVRDIHYNEP